ncbi:GroES-like protein [Xylaria intraflava]|nr:GroES-like protein [Xylaria intraflava]
MASTTKAIVIAERGKAEIKTLPIPKVRDGYVLVKVNAVGLNPTDWKSIHGAEKIHIGSRSGCDYAGEVAEVGPGLAKDVKKGDRISGMTFGANPNVTESGAFGGYTLAKPHMSLKTPAGISDEEAATLGVAVITVGQGLYQSLQLPLPNKPASTPFPILIYGGSTGMGLYGIKYAKLSGLTVIATSSPHNFDLLKSLGADHVFDYKSPTVGADIRALTKNKLKYAWDCTGFGGEISAAALSDNEEGGKPKLGTIIPIERKVVEKINPAVDGPHFTLGYRAVGADITGLSDFLKSAPGDVEFGAMFWSLTQELLEQGKLKPIKPDVNRLGKGLEGVLHGLDELKNDKVSGTKLVYTL